MKKYALIYLIAIFTFIGTPLSLFSQHLFFKEGSSKEVLPFKFIHNLIIVQLSINGSERLNFIVDSGVGPMIITDPLLVDSLHTTNAQSYKIRGRGEGADLEAYILNGIQVDIKSRISGKLSAILLKEDPFKLNHFLGLSIHGIIGTDLFSSFQVEINYAKRKIKLYAFDRPVRKPKHNLPIELINGKPYVNTKIELEDGSIDSLLLLIDTGASHAISLDLTDNNQQLMPLTTIPANLGIGLSGPITGTIGRLKSIGLGDFDLKHVIAAFPRYEDPYLQMLMSKQNGSIGGEILRRFKVFINYLDESIYFKTSKYFKDPLEYDMSGMEIYIVNDDNRKRYFINRVEKGSPAEKVGLREHDEILFIDAKDIRSFTVNEVYALLQKETKKDMLIHVLRGNQILFKLLKLRRRI